MKNVRNNLSKLNKLGSALFTDKYELTMMYGYHKESKENEKVVFDMFFRTVPDGGGYALCTGLELMIEQIQNLKFSDEEIEYLRRTSPYSEEYLNYLKNDYKFSGTIEAVPEGTVIFPNEPIVKVTAKAIEAQHIEDIILNTINSQTLIATKASRICYAAGGAPVLEFGLRRGSALQGATLASRAAYIGGCASTSNEAAGMVFDIPTSGTMAHSWILIHDTEFDAFMDYANLYKENIILLVDTYDTLKSGVPNAIKVFTRLKEEKRLPDSYGVRLDSGDLAYLSKEARKMFDEAGFTDAKICASNDLDERLIQTLKYQDAKIDIWAAGTKLITSYTCPAFNGVYKVAAKEDNGKMCPVIKLSEDKIKVTNPGDKMVYRIIDKETGNFMADLITLVGEKINEKEDLVIFDPVFTSKKKKFVSGTYSLEKLLVPVFKDGECVYPKISTAEIKKYAKKQLDSLWPEVRRFDNPHGYYVDLSQKLYDLKENMIEEIKGEAD